MYPETLKTPVRGTETRSDPPDGAHVCGPAWLNFLGQHKSQHWTVFFFCCVVMIQLGLYLMLCQ